MSISTQRRAPDFTARRLAALCTGWMFQVWKSEELEEYTAYVVGEQTVRLWMHLSCFGSARALIILLIDVGCIGRCIRGMLPRLVAILYTCRLIQLLE